MKQVFGVLIDEGYLDTNQQKAFVGIIKESLESTMQEYYPDSISVHYSGQVCDESKVAMTKMNLVSIINKTDARDRYALLTPHDELNPELIKKMFGQTFQRGTDNPNLFKIYRTSTTDYNQYILENIGADGREDFWIFSIDSAPLIVE